MEKYGFYGGCFNPPTKAHMQLAQAAIKQFELDKLFFVPVGDTYVKSELANEKNRYEMLNLIIKDIDCDTTSKKYSDNLMEYSNQSKVQVLGIELNQNKKMNAIDAFEIINKQYSKSKNYFIMGADNFCKLSTWKNNDELIKEFNYIIFERKNVDIKNTILSNPNLLKYEGNFNVLKSLKIDCSSTEVRNLIKLDKHIELEKYLNSNIINYIKENNLYKCDNYKIMKS